MPRRASAGQTSAVWPLDLLPTPSPPQPSCRLWFRPRGCGVRAPNRSVKIRSPSSAPAPRNVAPYGPSASRGARPSPGARWALTGVGIGPAAGRLVCLGPVVAPGGLGAGLGPFLSGRAATDRSLQGVRGPRLLGWVALHTGAYRAGLGLLRAIVLRGGALARPLACRRPRSQPEDARRAAQSAIAAH